MSSEFLSLVGARPARPLPMSWHALARLVALLGQLWSRHWRAVKPGCVSDAWLHDFEVASGKQRDR